MKWGRNSGVQKCMTWDSRVMKSILPLPHINMIWIYMILNQTWWQILHLLLEGAEICSIWKATAQLRFTACYRWVNLQKKYACTLPDVPSAYSGSNNPRSNIRASPVSTARLHSQCLHPQEIACKERGPLKNTQSSFCIPLSLYLVMDNFYLYD